jgi:4-aminobutyrate aminotransferase/(S)-3-amino-2-methylpropionate transaminase
MAEGLFDMQSIYRAMIVDDERSQGVHLVDLDGNVFLDFFSNFALGSLGYNHPAHLAVARSEAFVRAACNPTSTPFVTSPSWISFVSAVEREFAPPGMAKIFCVDGGGEGVEAALKAAFIVHGEKARRTHGEPVNPLQWPEERQRAAMDNAGTNAVVLSFSGAFHGRGLGPLSATHSKLIHKADQPAFAWPQATFPAHRFPRERFAEENARAERDSLAEVERLLDQFAGRVAAILVEPVQSEGGDRHASPAFFQQLQALAHKAGAALILDEVQTGVGISGTLWAHQQLQLAAPPDLVTFGKKMQLGGFFATPSYNITQFGRMYQTRNGDRARGLLALATLQTISREDLLRNVRETGAYFLQRLEELATRFPHLVSDPRGLGFLLAFDLPTTQARDELLQRSLRRGLFATYTGTRSVRIRPHLITRPVDVDFACEVFDAALREM